MPAPDDAASPKTLSPERAQQRRAISAHDPDWSRERPGRYWEPSKRLIAAIRAYQRHRDQPKPWSFLAKKMLVLQHRFWSVVTASDIPLNSQLEGGLILQHPVGVVIHPDSTVGPNCLILQHVTLVGGVRVGGHVDLGAGAKVVRPVTIGDHAVVGANAVVVGDVPAGATVAGVPARIVSVLPDESQPRRPD